MPAWLIPAIQGAAMIASQIAQNRANKKASEYENMENRLNTDIAYNRQKELMKFQMDYNSPTNQMQRFKDAGLNPNLVYGQGSPGNLQSVPDPPRTPPVRRAPVDYTAMASAGMQIAQMKLMQSQTGLTEAKTDESTIKQDLIKAQTQVTKSNPYLSEGYVASIVAQMKATAEMKKQEADWKLGASQQVVNGVPTGEGPPRGFVLMSQQLRNLEQKFNLSNADLKLKAEILQSKEFQNALSEIQVNWMKDGDITPQHIFQGIFMLLQSMMR